jgi:hypothetical protein
VAKAIGDPLLRLERLGGRNDELGFEGERVAGLTGHGSMIDKVESLTG